MPRYIEVIDEIPRTPNQEVKKADLRERGITPETWDREAEGVELRK